MSDSPTPETQLDPFAALAHGGNTANSKVVYARNPDPANTSQTPVLAAMNCFPMWTMAQLLSRMGQTTARNMNHNDPETVEAFQSLAAELATKIKNYPAYTVSLAYCSKEQAKVVKAFAAGSEIKDNASDAFKAVAQVALAKATILA